MTNDDHPLDQMIREQQARIAEVERELEKAKIELGTLLRARDATGGALLRRRGPGRQREKKRERALSEAWQKILIFIAGRGERGASNDEILEHCDKTKFTLNRNTLRSQMSLYAGRGLVERASLGRYRVTPQGKKAIMIDEMSEGSGGSPEPSS